MRADGTVWAAGRFGGFSGAWADAPRQIPGLGNVVEVVAGGPQCLALDPNGDVWDLEMGARMDMGVLARDDGTVWQVRLGQYFTLVATQVAGLDRVRKVTAGRDHLVALRSYGTAFTWGWTLNWYYSSPLEEVRDNAPRQVLTGAVDITSGSDSNWAVRGDGTAWAWGPWVITDCTGTADAVTAPKRIAGIPAASGSERVQHVSIGIQRSVAALRDDGSG